MPSKLPLSFTRHVASRLGSLALCAALMLVCAARASAAVTLTVAPNFASVKTGATKRFTAAIKGGSEVSWLVNGIHGGSEALGTISSTGLYTAPVVVPKGSTVTVTAAASGAQPVAVVVAIHTGASYYVATTGKDTNTGASTAPWRTIQHAANKATAGDTVYVLGGVYHQLVNLPHSGSATAGSIVFQSYPGQLAILDGSSGVSCCGGGIEGFFNVTGNQSYLIIEGFQLQNLTSKSVDEEPAGIFVEGSGSYIQILNNTVRAITTTAGAQGNAHGIGFYGNSATPLSNITLSGNTVSNCLTGNSETVTFDGNITNFTVTANFIHDNDNIGIDAAGFWSVGPKGHDQTNNGVISGNTVYNISSIKNPSYGSNGSGGSYGADGIYCDGCTKVLIARNLVYHCDLNIEAASENKGESSSYVTIQDNVVYGGILSGISIGGYNKDVGGSQHITIVNNTLFNNNTSGGGGDFQIQYHAANNIFENNIVYAGKQGILRNSYADPTSGLLTADYNLYYTTASTPVWSYLGKEYLTLTTYQHASGQEAHSHLENPGFDRLTLPYNFDLIANSPAIGSGNYALGAADYGALDFAGNARTTGKKIDIGAYE
jgi:hypothetical protein